MCHSALLNSVKGCRSSLSLITVCCSFVTVMFSDLPRILVWSYSVVKQLRAELETPGFQVDLISRASILAAYF